MNVPSFKSIGGMLSGVVLMLLWTAGCSTPPAPEAPLPIPRAPLRTLTSVVTTPKACPVLLVQATSSAPNESERIYASKITARMADWLQDSGIPATLITDDHLARGKAPEANVIILPCNPNPGLLEMLFLKRFVGKGGKLIVLYSAEPKLAELMGFRIGALTSPPDAGGWTGFRFSEGAPTGSPMRVSQESRNIRPVYPNAQGSRVIAWWETATGRDSREPAWAQSSRGFWMSHILLEGDVANKKQLLVSLLGYCDPALWQTAAAHAVNTAGSLNYFSGCSQAIAAIGRNVRPGQQEAKVQSLLTQTEHLQDAILREYRSGQYPRVLGTARQIDSSLTEAYARIQSPLRGEFRGVWHHLGAGFTPGTWDESCRELAQHGINAILPNVQRPWCSHYPSKLIPASDMLTRSGDQLEACLSAAQRHGLETHAWVILWSLEGAPESIVATYRRAGRLQVSSTGSPVLWLCPTQPDNRAFELAALRELAGRYPKLDGIQLDYIRYKSLDTCYCAGCRARFTKETGIRISRWPSEVRSGTKSTAYREWRRAQITRFVGEARRELSRVNPRLKLSASVYAGYPGCADSIGQDWAEWARRDMVDFVCPMNYTADTEKFAGWYRKQTSYPGVRGKVYAGIGVTSLECRLNAVQTMNQVNALRREDARGFTLFEYNPTLRKDILPYLGMGMTSR